MTQDFFAQACMMRRFIVVCHRPVDSLADGTAGNFEGEADIHLSPHPQTHTQDTTRVPRTRVLRPYLCHSVYV